MGTVEGDTQSGQDGFHDNQFGCKELELLKATDSSCLNYRISVILRKERERGGRGEEREGDERFIKSFYLRCTHTRTELTGSKMISGRH